MLISIDQQRVYKSQNRENLEKFLLNEGILYNWRIKQNEEYIKKAINGQAVKTNHGDVYFTKDVIYGALKNLETSDKRINRLFTRPPKKHQKLLKTYIQNNNLKEFKKLLFSLSDKEFFELNIDYRKLPKPLLDIYMDRFGNVEID